MDEQELKQRVLTYHQEDVSYRLTRVGVEEDRAAHLGDYDNVLRELTDPSPSDWALLRAAMLHATLSESLNMEHNRWLGEEIFTRFENNAERHLYYLTLDTHPDRPSPRFDPEDRFPYHHMTAREAAWYYSRAALAVLVSHSDPDRAIELFEELDSVLAPRIRFLLPGAEYSLYLERELERLPVLYERVGRFEDALSSTSASFTQFGQNAHSADVAIRRLDGWLNQLCQSGGVAEVERCLDVIYVWMDAASEVDDQERGHIGHCPTTTRQFWAWYYGNAVGRLLVARPSLRDSLLDEIEAGEWENCWHVAGVLFETPLDSWGEYRQRALKFYNASDIEHRREGPIPWGATQPPHLSAQSDLYWAIRVGFSDAHLEKTGEASAPRAGITDSLEAIRTIQSSTALHVLRSEQILEKLADDVQNRVMPSDEYWLGLLRERLPSLLGILPFPTIEHLIGALRRKFAKDWDDCSIYLCKSAESLFHEVFVPRIRECQGSNALKLVVPRPRNSPLRYSSEKWNRIPLSGWAKIIETTTEPGANTPLRLVLPQAFPDVDLDAVAKLHVDLATIAQLRGGSAHASADSNDQRSQNAEKLWELVVGGKGQGFLAEFHAALGIIDVGERPCSADSSC